MASYKTKKIKKNNRRKFLVTALVILLVVIAAFAFYNNRDEKTEISTDPKDAVIVAGEESQDPQTEDQDDKQPAATVQNRDGGAVDTGGQDATQTSQSLSSTSGKITVYSPLSNAVIKSGSTISGASSNSTVSYRLIDDQIGVIGTGKLSVVNGKFSGKFDFSTSGTKGRLDVYRELDDGREVDVVNVPVRYK